MEPVTTTSTVIVNPLTNPLVAGLLCGAGVAVGWRLGNILVNQGEKAAEKGIAAAKLALAKRKAEKELAEAAEAAPETAATPSIAELLALLQATPKQVTVTLAEAEATAVKAATPAEVEVPAVVSAEEKKLAELYKLLTSGGGEIGVKLAKAAKA
jgi:hypothetical protein